MPTVQKFDARMIEAYLKGTGWTYSQEHDTHFYLVLNEQGKCGCDLTCRFLTHGSQNEIYLVRVIAHKDIVRTDWGRALLSCNDWMKQQCWPRAYLHAENYDTDTSAKIFLEEYIDLESGVHQQLLNEFTERVVSGAINFWQWAHQKHGW